MLNYVQPPEEVIAEVVAGEYNLWQMPYQYINWAFVQLGKEPTANVGDRMKVSMIVDFHKACCEWSLLDEQ